MSEWRQVFRDGSNTSSVGRYTDGAGGATRDDYKVFDYPTTHDGSRPDVDDDTAGFSVQRAKEVQVFFEVGDFSGTVRLSWYNENAERWVEETSTITLPASGSNANNVNHVVQRVPRGMARCNIIVESTNGEDLAAWAEVRDDTV